MFRRRVWSPARVSPQTSASAVTHQPPSTKSISARRRSYSLSSRDTSYSRWTPSTAPEVQHAYAPVMLPAPIWSMPPSSVPP